jgi:sigma-B regulation protein RsbU (phosphoserine phosphatase)
MNEAPMNTNPVATDQSPEAAATSLLQAEVLVVDDSRTMRLALIRALNSLGFHNITEANDGRQALEAVQAKSFDLMLLDMEMPEMNGMEVLAAMRLDPRLEGVPVIVISGAEQVELAVQCIEAGAEDYLTKPPNPTLLRARVTTSLEKKRLRDLDRLRFAQLQAEKENLERTQRRLDKELNDAALYVRSILPDPVALPNAIDWHYEPTGELAGDSFGYHQIDDDHLAIYLLDVCGHGVGAALLSVSAINAIRTSGIKGVDFRDPGAVLGGLNEAFPMERNNDMYFTIWYGVYHAPTRTLRHASAGHPPALLLHPEHGIKEVNEPGMITGFMPETVYVSSSLEIPPGARLIVICDGTYEVTKPDGTLLGFDEFKEFMAGIGAEPDCFMRLLTWLKTLNGPGPLDDDFSLVRIQFP